LNDSKVSTELLATPSALSLSLSLRGVLWQSGGAEGADEDGP